MRKKFETKKLAAITLIMAVLLVMGACSGHSAQESASGSNAQESASDQAAQETSAGDNAQESAVGDSAKESAAGVNAKEVTGNPKKQRYSRVVALSHSIADMWLLAGGQLAGTTDDELKALQDAGKDGSGIVSVGGLMNASAEAIVALNPDLVLLSADIPSHKKLRSTLEEAGFNVLAVNIDDFEDYDRVMKQFTNDTGDHASYEKNVSAVAKEISDFKKNHRLAGTALFMQISSTKNKVLKRDNFVVRMGTDLGLTNVADDDSGLTEANVEAILELNPDYIFLIPMGIEKKAEQSYEEAFAQKDGWKELSAVKKHHVYSLPKDLFRYKPNNRWAEAYRYLYQLVNDQ